VHPGLLARALDENWINAKKNPAAAGVLFSPEYEA
jgi:hypothetical protein